MPTDSRYAALLNKTSGLLGFFLDSDDVGGFRPRQWYALARMIWAS